MKLNLKINIKSLKFQAFVSSVLLLFFFKLFFSPAPNIYVKILNEILVITTSVSFIVYMIELMRSKTINPLTMVMSVGILNAFIFFLLIFSDSILTGLFDNIKETITRPGMAYSIISFVYVFVIFISVSYIFLTFKELFFLKQNRNVNLYFNTMIVFFLLTSFATLFDELEGFSFLKNTFFIVSIILIFINSIKISWIAFIVKKEKIYLLFLSIVISVLFLLNLFESSGDNASKQILTAFSPVLSEFIYIIFLYGAIYFGILFFTTLFHLPTAEAFDRKAQEVSSLQYFSKLVNQVLDFKELVETVTEIAAKVCNADASWIYWQDKNETNIIANKYIGYVDAELITKSILDKKGLTNLTSTKILKLDKINTINNLSDNYTQAAVSQIKAHDELRGYLFIVKKNVKIFDDEDREAINTFSDYASIAIENSRLLKESIEKERLEKELDLAREIQRKILPAENPKYDKLDISTVFIPAFEVGGDYYDFFEIDKNNLGFIIADVSGKGISAAFIMAQIKGIFESLSKEFDKPRNILIKANRILKRTLDRKTFISAAFGVIDFENEVLHLARAGHCPILILRNGTAENLRPSGIGLGLNFDHQFEDNLEEIQIKLKQDDVLVLYTDGITEAKNNLLEDFGDIKFEKILLDFHNKTVDEITEKVIREVTLFSKDTSQHDDITLVVFKWKQKINLDGEKEWQSLTPQLQTKAK